MLPETFFEHCQNAIPAETWYVSLYIDTPYYGGPEEGGWWGKDTNLVAYQAFDSEELAIAVKIKIQDSVREYNQEEKRQYGEYCLKSMEWLESRALDADFLPEPDGECFYWVAIEKTPGEHTSRGSRHYE